MDKEPTSTNRTPKTQNISAQIRSIADQLKQETNLQIKATSQILGAAAQIAENHDQLIDEVVDMVGQDLDRQAPTQQSKVYSLYTVKTLKQQFGTLGNAKTHFGLKAASWTALADKLNNTPVETHKQSQDSISQRIEGIEQELKVMQADIKQVLSLLAELLLLVKQHPSK